MVDSWRKRVGAALLEGFKLHGAVDVEYFVVEGTHTVCEKGKLLTWIVHNSWPKLTV